MSIIDETWKEKEPLLPPPYDSVNNTSEEDRARISEVPQAQKFGAGTAAFNITTIVMGAGVLNLPAAVAATGWLGVLLLLLMGLLSGYTSVVLSKCMYRGKISGEPDLPTYTDVGEKAFGAFGKWFVSIQVHLTLIGVATIFLILCADFLVDVVVYAGGSLDITLSTVIVAAVLWLHVWFDDLAQLGKLSFLSVLATVLLVIVVVVDVFMNVPEDRGEHEVLRVGFGFWTSFVAFAFSFGAHPVLPSIVKGMRRPEQYPTMSSITFFLIALSYLPITIIGYWAFGDETSSPILNNVTDGPLKLTAIVSLLINLLVSYAVCIHPSEQALEANLERPLKLNQAGVMRRVKLVGLRTIFVGLTLMIAVLIPDFPLVLDLVASLTNTFTVFVLPCAFHSKIFWNQLSWPIHAVNFVIITIGFVACGFGTYNAMNNLIN